MFMALSMSAVHCVKQTPYPVVLMVRCTCAQSLSSACEGKHDVAQHECLQLQLVYAGSPSNAQHQGLIKWQISTLFAGLASMQRVRASTACVYVSVASTVMHALAARAGSGAAAWVCRRGMLADEPVILSVW